MLRFDHALVQDHALPSVQASLLPLVVTSSTLPALLNQVHVDVDHAAPLCYVYNTPLPPVLPEPELAHVMCDELLRVLRLQDPPAKISDAPQVFINRVAANQRITTRFSSCKASDRNQETAVMD